MRTIGWLSLLLALVPAPAPAARGIALRTGLVRAQCDGIPPGPCVPAFDFKSGVAELRTSKQPGPTCPKTGQPNELPGGTMSLTGVTKDGAAYDGALTGEVIYKTTFGADPNGNCVLAGVQIVTSSLGATLACKHGRCKGTLFPIACLPKTCADVPLTTELVTVRVCDTSQTMGLCVDQTDRPNVNAVATAGIAIAAAPSDAH